jgi:hypothetical protein
MNTKTSTTLSIMGAIAGMAGLEHGIGEIFQGNIQPENIVFGSWAGNPAFSRLAYEPAMSLLPNMLVSGWITVILSIIFIYWSFRFRQHKSYGMGFVLLSIALLLTGGGFGPPLLGMILGLFILCSNKKKQVTANGPIKIWIAAHWQVLFSITLGLWLFLFPVIPILTWLFHYLNEMMVAIATPAAFLFLALSLCSASFQDNNYDTK